MTSPTPISHGLVSEELQPSPTPSQPRRVTPVAVVSVLVTVAGTLLLGLAGKWLRDYNDGGPVSTTVAVVLAIASLYPWRYILAAFAADRHRSTLLAEDKLVEARRVSARGREEAFIAMGYAAAGIALALLLLFILTSNGAVAQTFFELDKIKQSWKEITKGFWINIWVACVAEVLVLVLGLLVAIIRMLPGRAGAPLRFLATVYADAFRAIPAIIVIFLVVFGIIGSKMPVLSKLPPTWLGLFALTLTYTAYVSEVYRAGLQSIHPSQAAAARSLGLSYSQTLSTVLVPQAVRRVIPPLLNDFIGLQKDTALLSIAGISEAFQVSTYWQSFTFSMSPVIVPAILFIIITIPQARFVDYLIERDVRRRAGKS
ncbi:MAG TPA: amino acid ABC transporter permease [Nocardioides sp.]|nr:amino acid ABC transporter permease [Nocardioides sp.]